MGLVSDRAFSAGDLVRRVLRLEQFVAEMAAGRGLESSSIGAGGVTVTDGGSIVVEGGDVVAKDGGAIVAKYRDSENIGVYFGDVNSADTGEYAGVSLAVWNDSDGHTVFSASGAAAGGSPNVAMWQDGGWQSLWNDYNSGEFRITPKVDAQIAAGRDTNIQSGSNTHLWGASVQQHGNQYWFDLDTKSTGTANISLIPTSSGNPRIHWINSSRRFKREIEDVELDPALVLQLRPRTFLDLDDAHSDQEAIDEDKPLPRRGIGYIAEEVHDLGLTELVEYDNDGRPHGLHYDRFSTALLTLCQAQQQQIDTQQAQIDALTARLDAAGL